MKTICPGLVLQAGDHDVIPDTYIQDMMEYQLPLNRHIELSLTLYPERRQSP